MGRSHGAVDMFLHNLRAGESAAPMSIEALVKVIDMTTAVADELPSVVRRAYNPLHSLGCKVTFILLYVEDVTQILLKY